ncbi:MAG: hypothetical protein ACI4PP_01425 [Clostridia bacterium]
METIVSSLITGAVALVVCLINNYIQNNKAQAIYQYKMDELTKRVDKHNNLVERTYRLEGKMREAEHDIVELKQKGE